MEPQEAWCLSLQLIYSADVYMVAFQEIVQLTAGQILQTDPAKRYVLGIRHLSQEVRSYTHTQANVGEVPRRYLYSPDGQ